MYFCASRNWIINRCQNLAHDFLRDVNHFPLFRINLLRAIIYLNYRVCSFYSKMITSQKFCACQFQS